MIASAILETGAALVSQGMAPREASAKAFAHHTRSMPRALAAELWDILAGGRP